MKIINYIKNIPKYFILGIQCIINGNKRKEFQIENKLIPITLTTLSLITYLIAIFILSRWYVQNERIKKFSESIINDTNQIIKEETEPKETTNYTELKTEDNTDYSSDTSYLHINFDYYKNINNETVAWIKVNGTKVNYPVVKHEDNHFYLNHDFNQKKSVTGWVYVDYRNSFNELSNNTILYGHNLINKTMFGSLTYLLKKDWFKNENNRYIKISTPDYNSIWQIFSVYSIEPTTDYLKTTYNSTEDYIQFLNKITERSKFNFNIQPTYEDKIITLSTCDDTGTKRVVIHAKLYSIE